MKWWRPSVSGRRAEEAPSTPVELLQERASAYLDGELTAPERAAFEAELATSEAAREQLDDLRMVRTALAGIGTVRAPRSFALLAPPAPVRTGPRRLEWATRAGTGVAALLFVVALTNGPSSGDTPVTIATGAREAASLAAPAAGTAPSATGIVADAATPAGTPTPTPASDAPVTAASATSPRPEPTAATARSAAPPPTGESAGGAAGGAGGGTGEGLGAAASLAPAPATATATAVTKEAAPAAAPSVAPATAAAPPPDAPMPSAGTPPGATTAAAPEPSGTPSGEPRALLAPAPAPAPSGTPVAFAEPGAGTPADFRPEPTEAAAAFATRTPDPATPTPAVAAVSTPPPAIPSPASERTEAFQTASGTEASTPASQPQDGVAIALGALTLLLAAASVAQYAARRRQHSK